MLSNSPIKNFDSETVSLVETNVIEASAGTGKTYSIAILTLRLIVEKEIPIQEILMVTFTKAAVAELETRIRDFVQLAYQVSIGKPIGDETISKLVKNSIDLIGEAETQRRLKEAILFLDETSILTIHSFCQKILSEYAFETSQIFGSEALSPMELSTIIVDQVNEFWRNEIIVLYKEILKVLIPTYLTREQILKFINEALSGKQLVQAEAYSEAIFSTQNQDTLLVQLNQYNSDLKQSWQAALDYIAQNYNDLLDTVLKNPYAKNKFPPLFSEPELLLNTIIEKRDTAYVIKIFAGVLSILENKTASEREKNQTLLIFSNKIYQFAIKVICGNVELIKEKNSLLTFDDMITKLHLSVAQYPNQRLIRAVKKKYQAVFIDEFQDTDRLQYEIFHGLFGTDTILFYIGDPKQSIYAWRKADIFTYFKAVAAANNLYGMNTNYRSTNEMIEAQNNFFLPEDKFDTFYFKEAADSIEYTNVNPPSNYSKGSLQRGGTSVEPISLIVEANNGKICESVASNIIELISNPNYLITKNGQSRRVKPSDFGILVRTSSQGKELKAKLAKYKLPAVTIDDTKLLNTDEAKQLLFVLKAVDEINTANINKALLSNLTGFIISEILQLNEETLLNSFKSYQDSWKKEGVYVMLMRFITDYQLRTRLLLSEQTNSERLLSNYLQLIEILHNTETKKKLLSIELINWLQKASEDDKADGDEFQQRIESDDEAIKILTIHKSKGLEYNIVFAPFLDLKSSIWPVSSFRKEDGSFLFANKEILSDDQEELIKTQSEQENRRLIYVAITRARYKCFIHSNTYLSKTSLKVFLNEFKKGMPLGIIQENTPQLDESFRYNANEQSYPVNFKTADSFTLEQQNWFKISYTFLNPEHAYLPKPYSKQALEQYDDFIFNILPKGAHTGNLLHYIFENIDFSDNTDWKRVISNGLKRLTPNNPDNYIPFLEEMLQCLITVKLKFGSEEFSLSEITPNKRLNEFEFDFTVQPFHTEQIAKLSTPETPFHIKSMQDIEGVMNGKMDLFFEKNGKYYLLDWKSNYLGNTLEDYSLENVSKSMGENNYHLQYHIYSVAIYKYLSLRIPNFNYEEHFGGVVYLFVRGVRSSNSTGIFTKVVNESLLNQIIKII